MLAAKLASLEVDEEAKLASLEVDDRSYQSLQNLLRNTVESRLYKILFECISQ